MRTKKNPFKKLQGLNFLSGTCVCMCSSAADGRHYPCKPLRDSQSRLLVSTPSWTDSDSTAEREKGWGTEGDTRNTLSMTSITDLLRFLLCFRCQQPWADHRTWGVTEDGGREVATEEVSPHTILERAHLERTWKSKKLTWLLTLFLMTGWNAAPLLAPTAAPFFLRGLHVKPDWQRKSTWASTLLFILKQTLNLVLLNEHILGCRKLRLKSYAFQLPHVGKTWSCTAADCKPGVGTGELREHRLSSFQLLLLLLPSSSSSPLKMWQYEL